MPVRSLSFVCPVGFPREPRSRHPILQGIRPYAPHSSARGRSPGGVHGLERASLRPRPVCAALSRRGCLGKTAPVGQRARPPGPSVGDTLGGFPPGGWPCVALCVAPSRRQLLEITGMCLAVTRPLHARVTERTHLFHGMKGVEGLELRIQSQTRHVRHHGAAGVRTKTAARGQERQTRGMSEGGIDAGETRGREPPRRLSGGEYGQN